MRTSRVDKEWKADDRRFRRMESIYGSFAGFNGNGYPSDTCSCTNTKQATKFCRLGSSG